MTTWERHSSRGFASFGMFSKVLKFQQLIEQHRNAGRRKRALLDCSERPPRNPFGISLVQSPQDAVAQYHRGPGSFESFGVFVADLYFHLIP